MEQQDGNAELCCQATQEDPGASSGQKARPLHGMHPSGSPQHNWRILSFLQDASEDMEGDHRSKIHTVLLWHNRLKRHWNTALTAESFCCGRVGGGGHPCLLERSALGIPSPLHAGLNGAVHSSNKRICEYPFSSTGHIGPHLLVMSRLETLSYRK